MMTMPMVRLEISSPDEAGECDVEVHIKTEDNGDSGATYRVADCGKVQINVKQEDVEAEL